jgi:hypothetical protein
MVVVGLEVGWRFESENEGRHFMRVVTVEAGRSTDCGGGLLGGKLSRESRDKGRSAKKGEMASTSIGDELNEMENTRARVGRDQKNVV